MTAGSKPFPAAASAQASALSAPMALALKEARKFVGATAPNPPVGAAGLDRSGNLLTVQAHERAGTGHAEAKVIEACRKLGRLNDLHTVVVTLEPCNHQGRTPACSEALIQAGVRRVIYGAKDPNPRVAGGGAERLKAAGIEVSQETASREVCEELIQSFTHWSRTGLPWVTVKTAWNLEGTMVPQAGTKTFTTPESLRFAHQLRKRADALITGSGTVLADAPLFTVRHVEDHLSKTRILILLDRRGRVAESWKQAARARGFEVVEGLEFQEALFKLGQRGCLEALVEAGPELSGSILSGTFWNSHVQIKQITPTLDRIETTPNVHWNHPKSRSSHFKHER